MLSAGRERAVRGNGGREAPRASLPSLAAERDLVRFSAGSTTFMTTLLHRGDGKRAFHPLWNRPGGELRTDRSFW